MGETPFPNLPATTIMPVITIRQPWATLVEIGAKQYETRSFRIPARLRGVRVGIQAAVRHPFTGFDQETESVIVEYLGAEWRESLPRGMIVATCILAETLPAWRVVEDYFGDYSPGWFAWRLEDVRPVRPHIPVKGWPMIGWPWELPEGFVV